MQPIATPGSASCQLYRTVDFVFISVKTYDLKNVKAELDEFNIKPRIAILVHNGGALHV